MVHSSNAPNTSLASVFTIALAVRLPLALVQRTPFQPDETYQSLEPAHHAVFGSAAYLSWEWRWNAPVDALGPRWAWLGEGRLRSSAWVALWAAVFWLLQALGLDQRPFVVLAPKAVMAVVAAACDTATFALARRLSPSAGPTALFLSLTSVFHAHALTRAFANSIETTLTTVGLCLWPSLSPQPLGPIDERRAWKRALSVAAVTCVLRPTNGVLWLGPGVVLLVRMLHRVGGRRAALRLLWDVLWIAALVLAFSTALDTALFPPPSSSTLQVSFPPLTFFAYNVLLPTSLFYGANSVHFYLTQGLPILLGLCLPWAVVGYSRAARGTLGPRARELAGMVGATTVVYSTIGHKEWRFLHPLLPILYVLTAVSLAQPAPFSPPGARYQPFPGRLAILFAFTALPQIGYLSLFHGAAQHEVMAYLSTAVPPAKQGGSVGVLMPCHSTPWQSHLHRPDLTWPDHAWFLECQPPLPSTTRRGPHTTEEQEFYADPVRFLRLGFPPTPYPSPKSLASLRRFVPSLRPWPSHLVFFGALVSTTDGSGLAVRALLKERGYAPDRKWRADRPWNGWDWAQDDDRRREGVEVWVMRGREAGEGES